jgi:hypothetical protein
MVNRSNVGRLPWAPALALAIGATSGALRAQPGADELLMRVGERVAEFYQRAASVICIETSTVQAIDITNSPSGFARTVESELHFEKERGETPGEATVVRKIRKVNGRAPSERDKRDRAGCTDPNPLASEPLAFLLPSRRSAYEFTAATAARERDRAALMIEFATVNRRSNPVLIEDPGGHDDCFDWSGHIASRGRIWVDAVNHDVLRVDRTLRGPVEVRVPPLIQQRHRLQNWVSIIRDDVTIRYKPVTFSNPDEVMLLPESIDTYIVVRGGLESTRRSQKFTNYRRFVSEGRVVE